ncbi:GNAT family N-acetyltransferase [Yoonia sp.]|jgi:aminoglycoside 6'-N-acetyltransferase|uniref:GNAT family N-acetyltransferase n=1 Tax=Yoonia sp. TaxID=2212373 RepID=UPI0025D00D0F|nr:GNAT family N-acetyltransferase [Yoonia sp.]
MRNYTFRPLTPDDLPTIRHWLQAAHVRVWWGDPDRNIALMQQDMDNPKIDMWMVELVNRPFAYMHDHDVHAFATTHYADLPQGTRAIETFVGHSDNLGQGHAVGYVDARLRDLRRRYMTVAAAPQSTDSRTIGIYAQTGFRKRRLAPSRDGKLVQVMTYI